MRRTAAEKMELIRLVDGSDLPVRKTLRELGISKSTFYDWYQRYTEGGMAALEAKQFVAMLRARAQNGWALPCGGCQSKRLWG